MDCFNGEMSGWLDSTGAADTTLQGECDLQDDTWANTDYYWQDVTQYYYSRGYGILDISGPLEYNEYSKAVFGDEWTLAEDPNLLWTYGGDFPILTIGVLMWRYLSSYHSGIPSGHDVMTGFWQPSEEEEAAGLKGHDGISPDFCTYISAIAAAYTMKEYGAEIDENGDANENGWNSTAPDSIDSIADGSLGWAAFQMI